MDWIQRKLNPLWLIQLQKIFAYPNDRSFITHKNSHTTFQQSVVALEFGQGSKSDFWQQPGVSSKTLVMSVDSTASAPLPARTHCLESKEVEEGQRKNTSHIKAFSIFSTGSVSELFRFIQFFRLTPNPTLVLLAKCWDGIENIRWLSQGTWCSIVRTP